MTQGYKLIKHALALNTSANEQRPPMYNVSRWMACLLLTAQANQGLNKFLLGSNSSRGGLLVWIFTPDLKISSSVALNKGLLRVMRLYWKEAGPTHDSSRLDSQSLSEGELEMPWFELAAMRACLEDSVVLVPHNALQLPGWKVALLERF
jgi:hypothetical protein